MNSVRSCWREHGIHRVPLRPLQPLKGQSLKEWECLCHDSCSPSPSLVFFMWHLLDVCPHPQHVLLATCPVHLLHCCSGKGSCRPARSLPRPGLALTSPLPCPSRLITSKALLLSPLLLILSPQLFHASTSAIKARFHSMKGTTATTQVSVFNPNASSACQTGTLSKYLLPFTLLL